MSNFVKINPVFSPDDNFWELNPQLQYMKPFNDLYLLDKDKSKKNSSKQMWIVVWLCEPDEEINKFYRIPLDERKQMIKETYYPDINYDDELLKVCIEQYPYLCLTSIGRLVKDQKDFLIKRNKFLTNAEYNFDTMSDLDNALSKNLKISEDFKKVEELFDQSKKELKARGNRALTLSEKKLI